MVRMVTLFKKLGAESRELRAHFVSIAVCRYNIFNIFTHFNKFF